MNLDYLSLAKIKEASRDISQFLDNGRFLWKQMILKNISGNHTVYQTKINFALIGNDEFQRMTDPHMDPVCSLICLYRIKNLTYDSVRKEF